MIKRMDIRNDEIAEVVLKLQLLAYQVEADLIDFYELPPLKDSVETLQLCEETFYGHYSLNGELSGVISVRTEKTVMDIHRLMVHPDHFRKGIAQMLLNFAENSEKGIDKVIVSTGSKNKPAVHFYEMNGFCKTSETVVAENLSLTSFVKYI